MNRNQLKYLAAAAMVADHAAEAFLPAASAAYFLCRFFGRITSVIMVFFVSEGFVRTSSRPRYFGRMFLFAVLSQVPYSLFRHGRILVFDLNMLFTLLLCLFAMWEMEKKRHFWRTMVVAAVLLSFFGDWGIFAPVLALLFYRYREDRIKQLCVAGAMAVAWISFGILLFASSGKDIAGFAWWHTGLFAAIPLLAKYNGKKGEKGAFYKWAFYVLYPTHLLLFWAILRV